MRRRFKNGIAYIKSTPWVWLLTLCLGLYGVNIFFVYPGFASEDTLHGLLQAEGLAPVDDWHPFAMTLLLIVFVKLTGTTSLVVAAQLLLLWGSLFLLSFALLRKTNSFYRAVVPLGLGLLPVVAVISGAVWKDVIMAFLLLFAAALLSVLQLVDKRNARRALLISAVCVLVAASLYRHNALLATVPLFLYTVHMYARRLSGRGMIAALGVFVIGVGVLNAGASWVLSVNKTYPVSAVQLDDILAIHRQVDGDEITDPKLRKLIGEIGNKCSNQGVDINSYIQCTDASQKKQILTEHDKLAGIWARTVVRYPAAYIKYRIYTFALFLTAPLDRTYIYESRTIRSDGENYHLVVSDSYRHRALQLLTFELGVSSAAILFKPILWLLLSIAGIVYIVKAGNAERRLFPLMLFSSAILYIFGYLPTAVATDYRYIYWPVLAVLVGLIWLILVRDRLGPVARDS